MSLANELAACSSPATKRESRICAAYVRFHPIMPRVYSLSATLDYPGHASVYTVSYGVRVCAPRPCRYSFTRETLFKARSASLSCCPHRSLLLSHTVNDNISRQTSPSKMHCCCVPLLMWELLGQARRIGCRCARARLSSTNARPASRATPLTDHRKSGVRGSPRELVDPSLVGGEGRAFGKSAKLNNKRRLFCFRRCCQRGKAYVEK